MVRASRDRLLYEHCYSREEFEDLHLDVAAWEEGATEHGRTSNNNSTRPIPRGHILDKVLQGLEHTGVLVGGHDERVAFLLEDGGRAFDGRINERNNFETTTKLAVMGIS